MNKLGNWRTRLVCLDAAAEQRWSETGQLRHLYPADVHGERCSTSAQIHRQQGGRGRYSRHIHKTILCTNFEISIF